MAIILSSGVAPALGTALFALSKSRNVLAGNLIWVLLFGIGKLDPTRPLCCNRLSISQELELRYFLGR